MESILKEAKGQYRVLYALLAGCGPMRAREALGLEIGKHISEDCRTRTFDRRRSAANCNCTFKTLGEGEG
jgi:hypothetical protein